MTAAFLSILERLTDDAPVLIAVDDVQWLDPSSEHVVAFVARRLSGPVGVIAVSRTDTDGAATTDWL